MARSRRSSSRRVEAGADETPFAADQRAIVVQRRVEPRADVGAQIQLRLPAGTSSALRRAVSLALSCGSTAACGRRSSDRAGWPGRSSRGPAAARGRRSNRSNLVQCRGQGRLGDQFGHRVQPARRCGSVGQRIGQPIGQQPRAHRRGRAIEHGQQRAFAAALAQRAGDLQAAARRFVDFQRCCRPGRGPGDRCAASDDFCVSTR